MKRKILKSIALFGLIISLSSCEMFGLKLQEDYDFKPTPAQPFLNMNAYDFIKGRKDKDMFLLYLAIEKAGIQKWYNDSVQGRTFIVPNDDVMKAWMTSKAKLAVTDFTETEIKEYLMPTICMGEHLTLDLSYNDLKVETLKPGYFVYFRLFEVTGTSQDATSWYKLMINGSNFTKTSNLRATNGIIHVISKDFNRGAYTPI